MTAAKLRGGLGLLSVFALASLPLGEVRASSDLVCAILWSASSASQSCSQATITYVDEKCEITAKCDRVGSSWWWDTAKVKSSQVSSLNNCDGRITLSACVPSSGG